MAIHAPSGEKKLEAHWMSLAASLWAGSVTELTIGEYDDTMDSDSTGYYILPLLSTFAHQHTDPQASTTVFISLSLSLSLLSIIHI